MKLENMNETELLPYQTEPYCTTYEDMEGVQKFNCMGLKLSEEERVRFYKQMVNVVVIVDVLNEVVEDYDWEGAGVLISEDGCVLTLSHMLGDNRDATVRVLTKENETPYGAEIISLDTTMGLAILKVKQANNNSNNNIGFPFANICENVSVGEEVYPIGHPGYLTYSFPIGHVSYACRNYDELKEFLNTFKRDIFEKRLQVSKDPSAPFVCFVDDLEFFHKFCDSVSFLQVNNVHGDGMNGASGMPMFNCRGEIIGLYFFLAHDQCFGIHAKTLYMFVNSVLSNDKSGKKKKKKSKATR